MIANGIIITGCEDVDWINLAQGGDRLWAYINTVMKLHVT